MRTVRVRLFGPLRFNLTGYDRQPVVFEQGIQEVPEQVAAFLRRNPGLGAVLADEPSQETAAPRHGRRRKAQS